MSFKNVDMGSALRRLADKRIEDAMKEGKFDNLAGAGKPLELEPMPAEENARLTWWCIRILKQNEVMPDEIRWRKLMDNLQNALETARTKEQVIGVVKQINQLALKINTLGTNAMKSAIIPLNLEIELERFQMRNMTR